MGDVTEEAISSGRLLFLDKLRVFILFLAVYQIL